MIQRGGTRYVGHFRTSIAATKNKAPQSFALLKDHAKTRYWDLLEENGRLP
jgi:hypothetical protein